jgi:uncharacterized membrane protein
LRHGNPTIKCIISRQKLAISRWFLALRHTVSTPKAAATMLQLSFKPELMMPHQWTPIITAHVGVAVGALILGTIMILARKGSRLHVITGRTWVGLMMLTALSSFFIQTSGRFSWIHLISIWVPIALIWGIQAARKGDIVGHRRIMMPTYYGGLVIAGLFTFLPQRLIGQTVMSWFS